MSLPDDSLPCTRAWREDFHHPCVRRLLESSGDTAYSAETYVLTALVLVLRYYSEEPWCRIEMEGMGCGYWPDKSDVAGAVGWSTLFYPQAILLHSDMATLLSAIASDLTRHTHDGGDYDPLQMRHALEDSLVQGIRMNYIDVQAQPSLRHFHTDHFNSDIYTVSKNALSCVPEFNIMCSAANDLSFHCRFGPTRTTLNDVQLLLARYKDSPTNSDTRLCQYSVTLMGAPTLWTL